MTLLLYIFISSVFLSIFYLAYKLIYRNETNFRQLRLYLLGSILLSLLVPFNNYTIETGKRNKNFIPQYEVTGVATTSDQQVPIQAEPVVNWPEVAVKLYLLVGIFLLLRIGWQILILVFQYIKSEKIVHKDCVILVNHRFKNNFSFFGWIFITRDSVSAEDLEQIIAHEKIHALQVHSFDLIVMELLTAIMWFNPLIWNLKNTIQLVHEYLADEGALNAGIDRIRYQSLLINQITEEKLICLSSSFNHALIKKRMIMMTTSKLYQKTRVKILALVPLSVILLLAMACLNGLYPEKLHAGTTGKALVLNTAGNYQDTELQNLSNPYDTIKKKTIVKVITSGNKPDTTITETLEIISSDDTTDHFNKFVWRAKGGELADSNKVIYYINEEVTDETRKNHNMDTVTILKVVKENKNVEVTRLRKPVVIMESSNQGRSNTLVIINGVAYPGKNAFQEVNPDQVETIEVSKDKKLIRKYTEKEYDGVIVITTKSGKTDSFKK